MKKFWEKFLWPIFLIMIGYFIAWGLVLGPINDQKIKSVQDNVDYFHTRLNSFFKDGADHCSWFSMNKEMQIKVFGGQIKREDTQRPVEVAHFYMCQNYKDWTE